MRSGGRGKGKVGAVAAVALIDAPVIHAAWLSAKAAPTAPIVTWENEEISPVALWIGSTAT